MFLAWRLWIINFILYIVFFYPITIHFQVIFRLVTVVEVFSFFSIVYQASHIPIDANVLGKQIRQFVHHNYVKSLSTRIKVANQFEFLELPASVGLSLANGVVVKPLTIIYVSHFKLICKLIVIFFALDGS